MSAPRGSDRLLTNDLERAEAVIRSGGLVAIPTETVYGLAADASNESAVRRLFEVKGRPLNHPVIVHISSTDKLDTWAERVDPPARILSEAAWPGPLTIVVPRAVGVLDAVTGGLRTIGLRVPAHPMTLELLRRVRGGLAAPSANRFGSVSPTTAGHVLHDLGNYLDPGRDAILDGGACPIGVESTIVDCTTDPPQILRVGGVPPEEVRELLHGGIAQAAGPARASGMLASHYAPNCSVKLVDDADDAIALRAGSPNSEILDLTDNLAVYARELYSRLRIADQNGVKTLIAVLPPAEGLGHAIRDRLEKAAAPRPL
jgi:L-threonylcarbamoyladenylate synthase